jgi:hypothetical protein
LAAVRKLVLLGALGLLAGCVRPPPQVIYVPSPPAYALAPLPSYDAPAVYVPRPAPPAVSFSGDPAPSVPARDPDPVPVAEAPPRPRGVAPDSSCGYWRVCNLPGWRYEN